MLTESAAGSVPWLKQAAELSERKTQSGFRGSAFRGVGLGWGRLQMGRTQPSPSQLPSRFTHSRALPFQRGSDGAVPTAQPQLPLPNLRLGGWGGGGGRTPCPTAGLVYTGNNSPALHGCVVRLAAKGRPSAAAVCLSAVT